MDFLLTLAVCLAAGTAPGAEEKIAGSISVTTASPAALADYLAGRDAMDAQRLDDARAAFERAIALDPKFALAHALLGRLIAGSLGDQETARAVELEAGLPPLERLQVEQIAADRRGEFERSRNLLLRLAALAPQDWRAQFLLGVREGADNRAEAAVVALRRALELNPAAAEAYNVLGFLLANRGDTEEGLLLIRRYARLRPGQPNPQDSLAEVLLMGGRLEEAEAAFQQAVALDPKFWIAWTGLADARFLLGRFEPGREALEKARAAATTERSKLQVELFAAWSSFIEGDAPRALKALDEIEAARSRDPYLAAAAPSLRARMLLEAGRRPEALEQAGKALSRAQSLPLAAADKLLVRVRALVVKVLAHAQQKQVAEAEAALGSLLAEARRAPNSAQLRSSLHFARGTLLEAQGKPARAREELTACEADDAFCNLQLVRLREEEGNTALAAEQKARMLRPLRRDQVFRDAEPAFLYAWTLLRR